MHASEGEEGEVEDLASTSGAVTESSLTQPLRPIFLTFKDAARAVAMLETVRR